MIIDAHVHIFPPEMVNNREQFFADEPEFKALYDSPKARLATLETVLEMMPRQSVAKAVLCGFPWRKAAHYELHNDYLAQARALHPDKLAVLGSFHPAAPQSENEARRCLELGLSGLGELAFYSTPPDKAALERLNPIMTLYAEAGLPVMLHANEPVGHIYPGKSNAGISHYYNFCKKFPQNKIILAHWGGGLIFYLLLKREAPEVLKNVWFDTAASPYLYMTNVYEICNMVGHDRILFGSDFPLLEPHRYIGAIAETKISNDAKSAILGLNAKNLFNFRPI